MKKYFGDKKFYKMVFILIIPIMIQQLFISLGGYVDSLMLNGFQEGGLAYNGVSAANKMMFVLNFLWMGAAASASIFVAQYHGAKNKDKVNESFRMSFYTLVILGFISSIIIFIFGKNVVDIFVSDTASRQYGYQYINIIGYGALLTAINISFANSFRSVEAPKVAMIASISGIIVNVILNFFLINGNFGAPQLGAQGAAIATVVSRVIECTIFVIVILNKKCVFNECFKQIKVNIDLLKTYLKRAIPLTTSELMWSLGTIILTLFCTYKNDDWFQAYSYSQNINDLFTIIFAGLGAGTAVIIGISLGSSKFDQAYSDFYKIKGLGIMMGLTVGTLMAITSPFIVLMFNPTPEMKSNIIQLLVVSGVFTAVYCYNAVTFFALRAGGDSLRAFMLDQLPTYLFSIPLTIYFGMNAQEFGLSLIQVFIISKSAEFIKIFIGTIFINQKKWLVNLT